MPRQLDIIGAPSSAGAYAPGQERAPQALRAAGLLALLEERGIAVNDRGDVPGFRWRIDRENPRAMNADAAADVARAVADQVAEALAEGSAILVLGGDCTVELGTVAGATRETPETGLVYIDYDTDMNTPLSVEDGALDWMGVAHMLGVPDTVPILAGVGPRTPMLRPDQVLLFANGSSTEFERTDDRRAGDRRGPTGPGDGGSDGCRARGRERLGRHFERLLVHVDVDVLDFLDFPIAEETRRNRGLRFAQLVAALRELVAAPNWVALTICEINPDHDPDGTSMRKLSEAIADVLAGAAAQGGGRYRPAAAARAIRIWTLSRAARSTSAAMGSPLSSFTRKKNASPGLWRRYSAIPDAIAAVSVQTSARPAILCPRNVTATGTPPSRFVHHPNGE